MPYLIIWEYRVPERHRSAFEEAYGSKGRWAEFFRKGRGYIRTELLHDIDQGDRYVTIDSWSTEADYDAFSAAHGDEYAAIDEDVSSLTTSETRIAAFTTSS